MFISGDNIGKTFELKTSSVTELQKDDKIIKSVYNGNLAMIVTAVTSLSVVGCYFDSGKGAFTELLIPKDSLTYNYRKLEGIYYLPNDGGWVKSYISRCVVRGWWKKAFEYAKEFHLMWHLEEQLKFIVDGLGFLLKTNKITEEEFKNIIETESWKEGQELTEKQLAMIEKAKGK